MFFVLFDLVWFDFSFAIQLWLPTALWQAVMTPASSSENLSGLGGNKNGISMVFFVFGHVAWHAGSFLTRDPGIEPVPPAVRAENFNH